VEFKALCQKSAKKVAQTAQACPVRKTLSRTIRFESSAKAPAA